MVFCDWLGLICLERSAVTIKFTAKCASRSKCTRRATILLEGRDPIGHPIWHRELCDEHARPLITRARGARGRTVLARRPARSLAGMTERTKKSREQLDLWLGPDKPTGPERTLEVSCLNYGANFVAYYGYYAGTSSSPVSEARRFDHESADGRLGDLEPQHQ